MSKLSEKLINKFEGGEPKGLSWLLIVLFLTLLSVAVMYFGGSRQYVLNSTGSDSKSNSRVPRTYSIFYNSGVFSPTNLRIHAGDGVEFQNKTFLPIKIVADNNDKSPILGFQDSGTVAPNTVFSFTFLNAGIFNYYNEKNPNEVGSIIVR